MRRLTFAICGLALLFGPGSVVAQDHVYSLSYFTNAHTGGAPDTVLRLINDGNVSDSSPAGDLCASIYVFDSTEELQQCCSCRITPNGVLSLSVNHSLTQQSVTGRILNRGVVKVVSSSPAAGQCNAAVAAPQRGIRGWLSHIQRGAAGNPTEPYFITEEQLSESTFGSAEKADLAEDCGAIALIQVVDPLCSCTDIGQ